MAARHRPDRAVPEHRHVPQPQPRRQRLHLARVPPRRRRRWRRRRRRWCAVHVDRRKHEQLVRVAPRPVAVRVALDRGADQLGLHGDAAAEGGQRPVQARVDGRLPVECEGVSVGVGVDLGRVRGGGGRRRGREEQVREEVAVAGADAEAAVRVDGVAEEGGLVGGGGGRRRRERRQRGKVGRVAADKVDGRRGAVHLERLLEDEVPVLGLGEEVGAVLHPLHVRLAHEGWRLGVRRRRRRRRLAALQVVVGNAPVARPGAWRFARRGGGGGGALPLLDAERVGKVDSADEVGELGVCVGAAALHPQVADFLLDVWEVGQVEDVALGDDFVFPPVGPGLGSYPVAFFVVEADQGAGGVGKQGVEFRARGNEGVDLEEHDQVALDESPVVLDHDLPAIDGGYAVFLVDRGQGCDAAHGDELPLVIVGAVRVGFGRGRWCRRCSVSRRFTGALCQASIGGHNRLLKPAAQATFLFVGQ